MADSNVNNLGMLDLDQETESAMARVNGKEYPVRTPSDLTMEEQMHLRRLMRRLQKAMKVVDDIDTDDEAEFDKAMEFLRSVGSQMIAYILPELPDEEREKLTPGKQERILNFFMDMMMQRQRSRRLSTQAILSQEMPSTMDQIQ